MKSNWTPTFSFDMPGDLTVSYASVGGDYFVDDSGIGFLRYTITCTPVFSTASGLAVISGHGLSLNTDVPQHFFGDGLLTAGSVKQRCPITLLSDGRIRILNQTTSASLGPADFVSGQSVLLQGQVEFVLNTA